LYVFLLSHRNLNYSTAANKDTITAAGKTTENYLSTVLNDVVQFSNLFKNKYSLSDKTNDPCPTT